VLKLRLATSETYLDRNRARQERTEWHNVVIWGKRAEALSKIITKGTPTTAAQGVFLRRFPRHFSVVPDSTRREPRSESKYQPEQNWLGN